jgi:hypothetical protein
MNSTPAAGAKPARQAMTKRKKNPVLSRGKTNDKTGITKPPKRPFEDSNQKLPRRIVIGLATEHNFFLATSAKKSGDL